MDRWTQPRRLVLALVVGLTIVVLLFPILIVIPLGFSAAESLAFPPNGFSPRWYLRLVEEPAWRNALVNSFQVAIGTVALSLLLGVPMALALVRGRFRGIRLLGLLVITPLIMPTLIVAIGVYYTFTLGWSIGPFGISLKLVGGPLGLILAHTGLAIPMVVVLTIASLRTIDRNLELAASGLGAGPWATFRTVTLPLMLPGVAGGAVFAFLISWDEATVSLFLTNAKFTTFPVRMFLQVREAVDPSVASAATILVAATSALFAFGLLSRMRGT